MLCYSEISGRSPTTNYDAHPANKWESSRFYQHVDVYDDTKEWLELKND